VSFDITPEQVLRFIVLDINNSGTSHIDCPMNDIACAPTNRGEQKSFSEVRSKRATRGQHFPLKEEKPCVAV
jgi:hypothetical protein